MSTEHIRWLSVVRLGVLTVGLVWVLTMTSLGVETVSHLLEPPGAMAAEFPAEGDIEEVEGFNNASASAWGMFRGAMLSITVLLVLIGGIAGSLMAQNRGAGALAGVGLAVAVAALIAYSPSIAASLMEISDATSAPLSGWLPAVGCRLALLDPITLSMLIGAGIWRSG